MKRRERAIWIKRVRRFAFLVFLAVCVTGGISFLAGTRVVMDGVVRANVTLLAAPMQAKVASWAVRPGMSVTEGEILGVLEPTIPDTRSGELLAEVDVRVAQLAWFDAGGELDTSGRELRVDRVAAARRSEALERAQRPALEQVIVVRERESVMAQTVALEAEARLEAAIAAGEARLRAGVDALRRAEIASDLAAADEAIVRQLGTEGIQSKRAVAAATAASKIASAQVTAERSAQEALAVENEAAAAQARASLASALAEADVVAARLEAARAELRASNGRADAWAREAQHHEALEPRSQVDVEEIRRARRAKLVADVEAARQAHAANLVEVGAKTLIAESPGVVDEIIELEGALVERGAQLARICDARRSEIVIYATPSAASEVAVGDLCTVYCSDDGRQSTATVQAVGRVWIAAPASLGLSKRARVAVTLTVDESVSPFSANSNVKAAFETDRWTAVKARVNEWFQR